MDSCRKWNVVINPEAVWEVEQPGPTLHLQDVDAEMKITRTSSSACVKEAFVHFKSVTSYRKPDCTASAQKDTAQTDRLWSVGDRQIHRWSWKTNKSKQTWDKFHLAGGWTGRSKSASSTRSNCVKRVVSSSGPQEMRETALCLCEIVTFVSPWNSSVQCVFE